MSKVSVIICFYKRIKHLDCCLRSLAAAADCFDEVVVSDDGSPPEIVEQVKTLIQTQPFPVRYAWQPKNKFQVAGARNNGALHASGDYLIFWDCDFLLLPGTVEEHLKRRR
ncbi:MAG: glycosyltransferase [Planctomycetales bacterium]